MQNAFVCNVKCHLYEKHMISISLNNISHWIFNPRNFKLVSISNLIICLHFSRLFHFTFLFVSNNKSKNRINFASNRIGKICIFELRTFKWNENENIFVYLLEFMITSSNRSRNGKKSNNNKKKSFVEICRWQKSTKRVLQPTK